MRAPKVLLRIAAATGALSAGTIMSIGAPGVANAGTVGATGIAPNFALAVGPSQLLSFGANSGCNLGNGVKHVFYIGFDNLHLRRDDDQGVYSDGDENDNTDTNVPSDLEQIPALYNFLRGTANTPSTTDSTNWADGRNPTYTNGTNYPGGVLLTNQHTPLIAHTSDDFTASYTGLYGGRTGIATSQNSVAAYTTGADATFNITDPSSAENLPAPVGYASGFAYWTDPINTSFIPGDNTTVFTTPNSTGQAVNPSAPWEPFTEAGCDVGAVAATGFTLENSTSTTNASTASVKFSASNNEDLGIAVHCANPTVDPNTICAEPGATTVPDKLTGDPSYTGYTAIFGNRFVAPAINSKINPSTSTPTTLSLLPSRPNTAAYYPAHPSFFPGFNAEDGNYTLGYTLDMQNAGVPVTFGYLSDAHDCHGSSGTAANLYPDYGDTSPPAGDSECNYTDAPGSSDPQYDGSPNYQSFGTGEAGYENYLAQLNSDFQSFFNQALADGYTTSNSEFVFYSDEQDDSSEGNPANPSCTGVPTTPGGSINPCEWNHSGIATTSDEGSSVPGQLGEVFVNLDATLPAESQYTNQPYFINPDSAPDIYLENGTGSSPALGTPSQTAANVRQFERDLSGATYTDPYTGATTKVTSYAADQAELNALNMVTADPLRTPTVVAFSPPNDFVNSVPAANGDNSSASVFLNEPTSNATFGCTGVSTTAPPAACSQSSFTYVHGDFAPDTDDTWAGFVGPGVESQGVLAKAPPIAGSCALGTCPAQSSVWTDETDLMPTLLDLVGLEGSYTPDGRVITQIINPSDTADAENTPALQSSDATTLGTDLKELDAPVYMSNEGTTQTNGSDDGFGTATLVADTAALPSGNSLYTTVEADITSATSERNAVVSDIQAQLMAAELNNTPTNGATDEADTSCLLTYANSLKAFALSGGTIAAPTDCNILTGPPAQTPEIGHSVLLVMSAGVVLAGLIFFAGRRRRPTLGF